MKRKLLCLVLALALTGCASPPAAEEQEVAEPGRETSTDLVFTVEGEEETVPATLYLGWDFSMYIPDEGWCLEADGDTDDAFLEVSWKSSDNEAVSLKVFRYDGESRLEARDAFMQECGYVFEDGMGGGFGDPLTGINDDGGFLSFMTAEGDDGACVISWEYPAEAAEGFGARLEQIAGTFMWIE